LSIVIWWRSRLVNGLRFPSTKPVRAWGAVCGMVPVGDAAALVLDVGALQRSALAEA
jgi:hypothetical protein